MKFLSSPCLPIRPRAPNCYSFVWRREASQPTYAKRATHLEPWPSKSRGGAVPFLANLAGVDNSVISSSLAAIASGDFPSLCASMDLESKYGGANEIKQELYRLLLSHRNVARASPDC